MISDFGTSPARAAWTVCIPGLTRSSWSPVPVMTTSSPSTFTFTSGSLTRRTIVPSAVRMRSTVATNSDPAAPSATSASRATEAIASRRRGFLGRATSDGGVPRFGARSDARQRARRWATSEAVWNRPAGSLAWSFATIASSQSGTSGFSSRIRPQEACRRSRGGGTAIVDSAAERRGRPMQRAYRTEPPG